MNIYKVVSGNPGIGKSTYIKHKYSSYFLIDCDIPFIERTYSIIESSLSSYFKKNYSIHQEILNEFYDLLSKKDGVIVDNTEKIDIDTLKLIVNISKLFNKTIIFIFDIPYNTLHTNTPFIKLLEWNIISISDKYKDFCVETVVIEQFIKNEYPSFDYNEFKRLLDITGYNFNEIKKLMWINNVIYKETSVLSDKAISEYRQNKIEKQLLQLEPQLSDVLKKSSIIGQVFEKYPLESVHGFHILGISNYLCELELLGTFISKLINRNDYYQFITPELFADIFASIHSTQKCEWQEILKNYYIYLYKHSTPNYTKIELIIKAKNMALELMDSATVSRLNRVLLNHYLYIKDFNRAILIIDELLIKGDFDNKTYKEYLVLTKLQLLLSIGGYRQALNITETLVSSPNYTGGEEYILYHHVKCLYNCGDVDSAFFYINNLVKQLKNTSKAGISEQKIYPLAYSMMASIQNHLGIEDEGKRYYKTALNYAYNNIGDKELYYSILSKCEMFYSNQLAIKRLKESADFFIKKNDQFNAARVYFNLATEMLFSGSNLYQKIEEYFTFAKKVFQLPDEHLAYVKNNHAIFLIMVYQDFQSAIEELESALFVGLSDFTYMTIYLNISMVFFYLYGDKDLKFISAYKEFKKYERIIERRKNRTKYEVIYRIITEIIFFERNDKALDMELQQYWSKNHNNSFFKRIIAIITNKSQAIITLQYNSEDITLLQFINEYGLFLAEFRFWD